MFNALFLYKILLLGWPKESPLCRWGPAIKEVTKGDPLRLQHIPNELGLQDFRPQFFI